MNDSSLPAGVPGYWMHETGGELARVVRAYLAHEALTPADIGIMRAYLDQWIWLGAWNGPAIADLRRRVGYLPSREAIEQWLDDALAANIDPL